MSARVDSWAFRPPVVVRSPIRVPKIAGAGVPGCRAAHDLSWVCTRPDGHTGRHAARLHSGEIVAVWQ